jgi:hypothetical protein
MTLRLRALRPSAQPIDELLQGSGWLNPERLTLRPRGRKKFRRVVGGVLECGFLWGFWGGQNHGLPAGGPFFVNDLGVWGVGALGTPHRRAVQCMGVLKPPTTHS